MSLDRWVCRWIGGCALREGEWMEVDVSLERCFVREVGVSCRNRASNIRKSFLNVCIGTLL